MKRLQIGALVLVLVLMFLVACTPAAAPAPAPAAPAAPAPGAPAPAALGAPAKPAWQIEWEKTLQAAKTEGVVAWPTAIGAMTQRELAESLKSTYGLRSESIQGSGGVLSAKIMAERRAGLYLWDVLVGGLTIQTTVLKPAGATVPLEPALMLPDVTDPEVIKKVWYEGRLPWVDKERHMIGLLVYVNPALAINTNLVKSGEIQTWDDLLSPKWKRKILLINPTRPGLSEDSLMPMLYEVKGEAWVRKLAAQEPAMLDDDNLAFQWLAQGKYAMFAPPRGELFVQFSTAGAPIVQVFPKDGVWVTSGPTTTVMLDRVPHPNAAKVFINWLLTKEAVTIASRGRLGQSARMDVPTDFLPPEAIRQPGFQYWRKDQIVGDAELYAKIRRESQAKSLKIFGPPE